MDFPSDVATNVFRIDDINEIAWAFYLETYPDRTELQADLRDDGETGIEGKLILAECALRDKGKHTLPDEENHGLWVFSLSKTDDDGVSEFLNSIGYHYSKSGILRSVDMDSASAGNETAQEHHSTSNAPTSMFKGSREANSSALGVHIKSDSQTRQNSMDKTHNHRPNSRQDLTTAEMYLRVDTAISKSLSHSMADYDDLLRVGPHTFIESRTLGEKMIDDLAWRWSATKTSTISMQVNWLSSGTVLVAYYRKYATKLYRASHFLPDDRRFRLFCEMPLLLCPSGVPARLHTLEEIPETHPLHHSSMQLKSSISARLTRIGYPVPQGSSWLRVFIEHDLSTGGRHRPSHRPRTSSITMWPSHLCLCTAPIVRDDSRVCTDGDDHIEHGPMDALAEAESWLLAQEARHKALETQQWNSDSELLQEVRLNQDSGDENDLSEIELHANPYTTLLDVSSIYPTPPDIIPTNALDSSPNNNLPVSGIGREENTVSTPNAPSRPYEEHGNADIYGEIDIDMFASNGLTEADFSFFDEPGMDDTTLQEQPNQVMADDDEEGEILTHPTTVTISSENNMVRLVQSSQADSAKNSFSEPHEERLEGQVIFTDAVPGEETALQDIFENTHEVTDVEEEEEEEGGEAKDEVTTGFEHHDDQRSSMQRTSFDAVRLPERSNFFDSKYAPRGRYAFDVDDIPLFPIPAEQTVRGDDELPQIGTARAREFSSDENSDTDQTDEESSSGSCDLITEYENANAEQQRRHHQFRKRKRDGSEDREINLKILSSTSPRETSAERLLEANLTFPVQALSCYGPETASKEPLGVSLQSDTSHNITFFGKDHIFIRVAQMVGDQAVSASQSHEASLRRSFGMDSDAVMASDQRIESVMKKVFFTGGKIGKRCTIKEYASLRVGEVGSIFSEISPPQPNQRVPKTFHPTKPSTAAQDVFKLPIPYTHVRRTEIPTDISASALRFWEELSLAPAHSEKNVKAFCIFSTNVDTSDDMRRFLNMIKIAYQSCNLGLHDLGAGLANDNDGLIHVPMDDGNVQISLPPLVSVCKLLGTRLGRLRLQGGNFVIYMVDPSASNRCLPSLCAAFLDLFEAYKATLHEQHIDDPNDMVLQILPSSLICSTEFIPMPTSATYRKIAFDVYDRCSPNRTVVRHSQHRSLCAPAVYLAKAIPKAIDLKLTPESSVPRLQSDNCIHVAYAWTSGDHWLTAAWIDNHGTLSWNACYCFGNENETPWESFTDIAREIWGTTLDLMQGLPSLRVFICKDSPADSRELDAWRSILVDVNKRQISTSFFTLDTDPLLDFPKQEATNRLSELASGSLTTPEATPQSNAASPDISNFGTTPGGPLQASTPPSSTTVAEHDAEARLVDVLDETWGVIVNSPSALSSFSNVAASDNCPTLASGYLIKRAGPRDEDGLTRTGIKLLYGQTGHRMVLKEVLSMYGDLALLARARGVEYTEAGQPAKGALPYHVTAARKAHTAVSTTMRYGEC